jgi:hypothetical protein
MDSISLGLTISNALKSRVHREDNYKETVKYMRALRSVAMDQIPLNSSYSDTSRKTLGYNRLVNIVEEFLNHAEVLESLSGIEGQAYLGTVEHHSVLISDCLMEMHPSGGFWTATLRSVGLV